MRSIGSEKEGKTRRLLAELENPDYAQPNPS